MQETGDDIRSPLPYYPPTNHAKQIKRISLNQSDNISTNSAMTLRTDSYRQAHPLQSFAFDYPKRPLLAQSTETNPSLNNNHHLHNPSSRRKLNGNKQYEISV